MLNRLHLVALSLAACTSNVDAPTDGTVPTTGVMHITASTTWTGAQQVLTNTQIDPGVTVTVAASTTLSIAAAASLTVAGTLAFAGTSGGTITVTPADGAIAFGGISIPNGGVLTMAYATVTGGSIITSTTGKATIVDSRLSHASGDLLIMNGGTIDVEYSAIGVEPPATDSSHCDLHFGGTGNVIKFQHSTATTAAYGAMFYSGMAADFTYDNWYGNGINVDVQPGVNGDFSNSYFQNAPPTGTGITIDNPATGKLAACTGTNDTTCAGPRP